MAIDREKGERERRGNFLFQPLLFVLSLFFFAHHPGIRSLSLYSTSLPPRTLTQNEKQALAKKSDGNSRRISSHALGPSSTSSSIFFPRLSRKAVADAAAWAGNISSSVLIIFVNKYLMGRKGYDFHYGE